MVTLAGLLELLELLRAEVGRLELDARRFDQRGYPQLAADLHAIRRRCVRVLEAAGRRRGLRRRLHNAPKALKGRTHE